MEAAGLVRTLCDSGKSREIAPMYNGSIDDSFKAELLENTPVMVAFHDIDMNIAWANRAYREFTGLSIDELKNGPCYSVLGLDGPCFQCPVRKAIEKGEPAESELVPEVGMRRSDDRGAWRLKAVPTRGLGGETTGAVSVLTEITGTREAEQVLEKQEQLLREIGKVAKIGGWEFDPATGEGTWTEETARIHGVETGARTNMEFGLSFYRDESREKIERAIAEAVELGSDYDLELELFTSDGTRKWVHTIGHPYVEDGKVTRVAGSYQDITERKLVQEAAHLAHGRFRSFVDANIVGVVVANAAGDVIEANDYYMDLVGFSREELKEGRVDWRAITPPEWLPADEQAILELRASGTCAPYEKEYLRRDGSRVPVLIVDAVIPGPEEEIAAFVLDLTERNRARGELQALSKQRQLALNASKLGWWHYDPETRMASWDERYREIFGVTGDKKPNNEILKLLHPEDLPRVWAAVGAALDPVEPRRYSVEYRVNRPDGDMRWVEAHGIAEFEGQGEERHAVSFVGTVQDITERKRGEEELWRNARRLAILHEIDQAILPNITSPEAIAHVAMEHLLKLLSCQRASIGVFDQGTGDIQLLATATSGDSALRAGMRLPEEALGDPEVLKRGKTELVEDVSSLRGLPEMVRLLKEEGIRSFINIPLVAADVLIGALNVSWEEARAFHPEEAEVAREVAGQVAIALEHSRLRAEAQRHALELEERVRERTAQLDAANQELEAFAYSVSHDLRAPLRAIDGYVQILEEDCSASLDTEGRRVCSVIRNSAKGLGKLIDDLLTLSRLGRAEIVPSLIDMRALANSVFLELTTPKDRERIDFEVGDLPSVSGDRTLVHQVWMNIISNALKFSSKEDRSLIEITGEREEGEAVYSIRDNGAGFDMKYAGKLFSVFQRLHSAGEFEGTGVGLATVQSIVRRHGGRVWAESEPGKGATFHFALGDG